ncbi:phospholipase D/nuclease [Hypoxylon sp. NC1633]|nr:phospholipase D/nuclease [Hypoxylon sp. NC1633]
MDEFDTFGGDEDAALRYAIALSLQEGDNALPKKPIELSSDEDEDNLDKGPTYPPISKDLTILSKTEPPKNAPREEAPLVADQSASTPSSGFAALGIDRKKMEEERLARLRKRKSPDSEQDSQERRQRPKLDIQPTVSKATNDDLHNIPYPKGIVKKTWAAGFPRKDDIKIEEVLQRDELEIAVLSSFQWDEPWMLSKINFVKTKIVCIAFASNAAQQEEIKANAPKRAAIKFCFPPMMPTGNMHSKLLLLKYPRYLRIVVPSGNMVPYDWGETGVIENIVFLIDLPRIDDPKVRSSNRLGPFGEELSYFLKAQGLEDSLVNSLENYDFSEANRYRFIHTIASSHLGDKWQRTGYCGLGRAVKSLGLDTAGDIEIDFAVSSLGSVTQDLISAIYYAAQGDNGLKEYETRTTKGSKNKAPVQARPDFRNKFRIYFPSHNTVTRSRAGKDGAGTICVQSKWWDSATFPRELVHDCESVRTGLLSHSKLMMVYHTGLGRPRASYAYVGSANLSESAWGRLVKERGTSNPKLTCRNWECGVIVPIPPQDLSKDLAQRPSLSDFNSAIPVPMKIPSEAYGATKTKRPWFFLEN